MLGQSKWHLKLFLTNLDVTWYIDILDVLGQLWDTIFFLTIGES